MIEIKRNGEVFHTIEGAGEGSTVSCQLMEHHYVTLKFSTAEPVYFEVGDSVELDDFGYFELLSPYFPTKNETNGGYDYELRLDAYYWAWQNKLCKYRPLYSAQETSFELTSTIAAHMQVIVSNINALGYTYNGKKFTYDYTTFNKDVFDVDKAFYMQYDSISIIEALNALCDEDNLNCEWWVDGNVIYLGYCEMEGQSVFSLDDNMVSMSQSDSQADYITRLYAFGSDRNIPKGYFTGQDADVTVDGVASDYLTLPDKDEDEDGYVAKNGYLENTRIVTNTAKAIEGVVLFDDEYPKVTAEITSIRTYEATDEKEDGTKYTQTFYQLAAETSSFATSFEKSWIKDGKTLMVKFDSGSMNGMEFECAFKIFNGVNYFEIVVNDEYGRTLPDADLHPKVDDKFFLYNWDATKITETPLIAEAQEALYERAKNYYKKSMIDASNFTCVMDGLSFFNGGLYEYHSLGEQVKLIHPMFADTDTDGNHYRDSRIIGFEIKLDIPYDSPQYIIGEKAAASRLGQLESTIESITVNGKSFYNSGNGGGGASVYVIGSNDMTQPTDGNVFSSLRARKEFLSGIDDDTAYGVIRFAEGLKIDEGLYYIDKSGNVRIKSIVVNADYGIDENGNAKVETVEARQLSDDIARAEQNRTLIGAQGYEMYVDESGRSHLWVDELMVRMRAYFASLEIRKVSYSGGTTIFSNAGSTIVKVASITDESGVVTAYKCYAKADDGTTATSNWWQVGMQALCQTFNVKAGKYDGVSNRYYWRLVIGVGQETLSDGLLYDWVLLSNMAELNPGTEVPTWEEAAMAAGSEVLLWGDTGAVTVMQQGSDIWGNVSGQMGTNKGYDPNVSQNDAPQAGDVIVQVGDQLEPEKRGNVVKITTSTEDGEDNIGSSIDMYTAIDEFKWKGHWWHTGRDGVRITASMFRLCSGDVDEGGSSIDDYIDGVMGHNYRVETNSELALVTASSDGTITSIAAVSGLPAQVRLYDNNELIKPSEWTSLKLTVGGTTYTMGGVNPLKEGLNPVFAAGTEAVNLSWTLYKGKSTSVTVKPQEIVAQVTYGETTAEKTVRVAVTTNGTNGTSVSIKGSLASTSELPTSGNTLGDGYLIDGYLWVYTGTLTTDSTHINGFENVGKIQGEQGESAWSFGFDVSPLVVDDEEYVLDKSGEVYAQTGTSSARIVVKYGQSEATIVSATITDEENVGAQIDYSWHVLPSILGAKKVTSGSDTVTLPVGEAWVEIEVTAEYTADDGSTLSKTDKVRLPIVVAYTKHMGQLTLNDELFETEVKTVKESVYTKTEVDSKISQTSSSIEAKITDVRTDLTTAETTIKETSARLDSGQITLTADNTVFRDGGGNVVAVFNSEGLNADLINVRHIYAEDGSGNTVGHFGTAGDAQNPSDYMIWAGASSGASAPFSVTKGGKLMSTSGTIGGWNINASSLGNSTTYLNTKMLQFMESADRSARLGLVTDHGYRYLCALYDTETISAEKAGIEIDIDGVTNSLMNATAVKLQGGHIAGMAVRTQYIGDDGITQAEEPGAQSVTLDRLVNAVAVSTTYYWRTSAAAAEKTVSLDVYITLPDMRDCDDGHVVKIKRMAGDSESVHVIAGKYSTYDNSLSGVETEYQSILFVDNNVWKTDEEIEHEGQAMEFVFFARVSKTLNGTTYRGVWMQWKNPREW